MRHLSHSCCGPSRPTQGGFTLLELLIVLLIIGVVAGISFGTLREERLDSVVQAEAEILASVLRQTRDRAVTERRAYGVVFNITNGMGTSGVVLNNWDGGHGYRVIGPDQGRSDNFGGLPMAGVSDHIFIDGTFPTFLGAVADSWVNGEEYTLPQRQVRFLALSDTDEGPRRNAAHGRPSSENRYYDFDAQLTYPRPWFGYYDGSKLWPWGGYDPSVPMSGLFYEGDDGAITGSQHPTTRSFGSTTLWEAGDPRPVIDADWMDACIMFTPSGTAHFLEWMRGRRISENSSNTDYGMGVHDRAKQRVDSPDFDSTDLETVYTAQNVEVPHSRALEDNGGVAHFVRHTGGFHITLAPDATVDSNEFATVDEAIDSFDPAWRVFVGEFGSVRAFRVQRRRSDSVLTSQDQLDQWVVGGQVWPSSPNEWFNSTTVYNQCRTGWLHEIPTMADGSISEDEGRLVPTGSPIVHIVTGRMLTDRIWWVAP